VQIKYLTEKLQREMNGLKIVRRHKRGLANFVGTAYKYLFGILDNNDKEELEETRKEVNFGKPKFEYP